MLSQSKNTFITPENKPKVTTLTGKNRIFKIGLISEYKIVKTTLAMARVNKLLKPTVGNNQAKIANEIPVIKIALIIVIVYKIS